MGTDQDGRLQYEDKPRNTKSTSNLSLMAWYHMLPWRLELIRIEYPANRDAVFVFDDPDGIAEQLRIDWANSQAKDHDEERRWLRTLLVENKREKRKRKRGGGRARAH